MTYIHLSTSCHQPMFDVESSYAAGLFRINSSPGTVQKAASSLMALLFELQQMHTISAFPHSCGARGEYHLCWLCLFAIGRAAMCVYGLLFRRCCQKAGFWARENIKSPSTGSNTIIIIEHTLDPCADWNLHTKINSFMFVVHQFIF